MVSTHARRGKRLHAMVAQSRDRTMVLCSYSAQSQDSENAQRNLEIVRNIYTNICISVCTLCNLLGPLQALLKVRLLLVLLDMLIK